MQTDNIIILDTWVLETTPLLTSPSDFHTFTDLQKTAVFVLGAEEYTSPGQPLTVYPSFSSISPPSSLSSLSYLFSF